jgi:hypothetical protein
MKKIIIDGKTFVSLNEVEKTLKHGLKPRFETEITKKEEAFYEELHHELIKDINQILK